MFLTFNADDPEIPQRIEVWKGLYLLVHPQCHALVGKGVFGYFFTFSRNSDGTQSSRATNQPGHGITAESVDAFHFRNEDNSGPNSLGPKNLNAPQELRLITYDGFEVEIRVLRFEILNADPGMMPSFGSLACVVRVSEMPRSRSGHGV